MRTAHAARAGRSTRFAIALLSLALTSGCATLGFAHGRGGSSAGTWEDVTATARGYASRGEFQSADSLLADFAARHPGTPEALETAYWRGVYMLDPNNRTASLTDAMASLDGYLTDTRPRQHLVEAQTLRRIATRLQALNRAAASSASEAREANAAAANANAKAADSKSDAGSSADAQAEIRRLREELNKANAELERIKKRLAPPPI